jgi:hypothetical protein
VSMESLPELATDRADIAPGQPANGRDKRKRHVATKAQLLTRDALDGRTNAAKLFDRLIADIESDLGGRDELSTELPPRRGAGLPTSPSCCRVLMAARCGSRWSFAFEFYWTAVDTPTA